MLPSVLSLKVAAIVGAAAFVLGSCAGAAGTYAFYSPRLELCEVEKREQGRMIGRQNEGIRAQQTAEEKRAAAAKRALEAARRARAQAEADAQLLLQAQPAPGEDRCAAASALIRRELKK